MEEIYILLADSDGTMRSIDEPFGVAVRTLEEAERFKKKGEVGYSHSYEKITVFDTVEEAIQFRFGSK